MTREEFLNSVKNVKINLETVKKIEDKYKCTLPEQVKKILSVSERQLFFDEERRLLSTNEIENATEQLHVDFIQKGIIPIIDAYENDFISYNVKSKKWCFLNLNDGSIFSEDINLESIL